MKIKKASIPFFKKSFSPSRKLLSGFVLIILFAAFLLHLPLSSASHQPTPFLDCLFTATSATCVTGLVVLDTGTHWSVFGKIIILLCIQLGGVGFMGFATFFSLLVGKKISLKSRFTLQNSYNLSHPGGIIRITKHILLFTLIVELLGALFSMMVFVPQFGLKTGIAISVFHSISAFCNAGFDLFGHFSSLTSYIDNPPLQIITMLLIIIGGLGFFVMEDLFVCRKQLRALSFHTKLVLSTTLVLILFGALTIFIFEYHNPATLSPLSMGDKIVGAFFHSVSPRTAGFNTFNLAEMTNGSSLIMILLMFVGGSPGSTAGGIKTTTLAVLFVTVYCWLRGKNNIELFHKQIGSAALKKAVAILIFTSLLIITAILILSFTESSSLGNIAFEVFSAFGTVGLSKNFTPSLTFVGKIVIMLSMLIGRLGPLTVALALSKEARTPQGHYTYPEGEILLG